MGCKRILMSNDWYPALQLPQVEVVDERITEVRPHAVVTADGTEHDVDTIVLGTGFAATEFLAPITITGRGGRDLHQQWKDGASAYLGTVVPGFPNLFVLYGPNTNLGHNSILVMLEAQVGWVVQAVRALRDRGIGWMDVRPDVAATFDAWVQRRLAGHRVRRRLPQLVPDRQRPQHAELAGVHAHLPPPAAAAAARGVRVVVRARPTVGRPRCLGPSTPTSSWSAAGSAGAPPRCA